MGKEMSYLTLKTDPVAIAPGTDFMTIVAIATGSSLNASNGVSTGAVATGSSLNAAMESVPGAVATGSSLNAANGVSTGSGSDRVVTQRGQWSQYRER